MTSSSAPSAAPASTGSTATVLLRLLPWARPVLPRMVLGGVVALVAQLALLAVPQVLQFVTDGPIADGDLGGIWLAGVAVLGLGVLEALMIFLRRKLTVAPSTRVEATMRNDLYRKLQELPVGFHDRWPSGQLLSRSMSDLGVVRRFLAFGLTMLVVNALMIVIGVVILLVMDWRLGLLFGLCAGPIIAIGFGFERRYGKVARRSQDQQGDLATTVEESVHGIRVLKAFGRGAHALRGFTRQAEQLRGTEIEKAKAVSGIWLWLILIPDTAYALCLLLGAFLTVQGEVTVGTLLAFFATAAVLRFPIESIGFLLSMALDTRNALDRYFEVLDEPDPLADTAAPRSIEAPRGELRFENVTFRYPDAPADQPPLLDGVDLTVEPGETIALVGLTGSGKTTLTALAIRLYDVTGGAVRIDGVDVRDLPREELRRHVATAFEEPTLFSDSVRENVLMGRPDAGEPAARQALEIAQAGFVDDLPEGLDTVIGEEGMSLSGGQRQRLALARAIAADPAVLVLDDPLSALDVGTEALVEAALREVMSGTTSLIVAHRPSTVLLADRVALLERGRIIALGTHTELLATSERYRNVLSSIEDEPAPAAREAVEIEHPRTGSIPLPPAGRREGQEP